MRGHGCIAGSFRPLAAAILLSMAAAPFEAAAQTQAQAALPQAPPIAVKPLPPGAWIGPPSRDFAIAPHVDAGPPARTGWGLFVTARGHSMDLAANSSWTSDANVRGGEFQVGLGWRQDNMSAMVGYVESSARAPYGPVSHSPRGVIGLSFALHTP